MPRIRGPKKEARIGLRLTERLDERIRDAAWTAGENVTEYVLGAVKDRIRREDRRQRN